MKKLLVLAALLPMFAHAITQDDVNFAQRQCAQRNDYDKCAQARSMSRHYQIQERNKLEYNAALQAGKPMQGGVHIYSEPQPVGAYHWNRTYKKYCYHDAGGYVTRCVN